MVGWFYELRSTLKKIRWWVGIGDMDFGLRIFRFFFFFLINWFLWGSVYWFWGDLIWGDGKPGNRVGLFYGSANLEFVLYMYPKMYIGSFGRGYPLKGSTAKRGDIHFSFSSQQKYNIINDIFKTYMSFLLNLIMRGWGVRGINISKRKNKKINK